MLISFEGIDGSGKSTQIALLKEKLISQGRSVKVFREPGGNDVSEAIREMLLDADLDIHPVTELLLFSSARAQLMSEKVKPALDAEVVILDRFYDSTTAYQGYGRKSLPLDEISQINHIASLGMVPDHTIYMRLSIEDSAERTAHMDKDRMERAGDTFFMDVIKGFDTLADQESRFVVIDATQSKKDIHQEILEKLNLTH